NAHPFDHDLRQAMKSFGNTLYAARPGGLLLGLGRCPRGRGDLPLPNWAPPYPLLRPLLHLAGRGNILRPLAWFPVHYPPDQKFLLHFGLRMLHGNHLWFHGEGLEPGVGARIGLLRQWPTVAGMVEAAARRVGPYATVNVFPRAGISYVATPP